MQTYVAVIGGKAVLAFRAQDDEQARVTIERRSMRAELQTLTDADGKPLWDGKSAISLREATAAERAEWQRSRDDAIRDGDIDLNAGHDPNDWEIYFAEGPMGRRGGG